jgi:hypothetical protein
MSSVTLRILLHGSLNTFTLKAQSSMARLPASMMLAGPVFGDLLFRRRQCVFIAFDLLYLNGADLRTLPLIDRKAMLKKLLRRKRLEGIVCKRKDSPYKVTEKPSRYWIKVKNSRYSQEGPEELFERT